MLGRTYQNPNVSMFTRKMETWREIGVKKKKEERRKMQIKQKTKKGLEKVESFNRDEYFK